MYLLKDITSDVIPWVSEVIIAAWINRAEFFIGIIIDILIIYSLLKQRDISIDSQFILSLTIADFLFCACFLGPGLYNALKGGWATGQAGCLFSTIAVIYTLGMSILSITGMTLHRYLIVIHQYHLTQKHVYIILSVLWSGLAIIVASFALSQHFREYGVGLTASLLYCFIVLTRRETLNIIAGYTILTFIMIPMTFLVYAYYRIVVTYSKLLARKKIKESESIQKSPEMEKNPKQISIKKKQTQTRQETRLITKAIAITGSFMICM
jgi:hypothetical protein